MGNYGTQNSHVVHQAQPASKVCAGNILLLGKEIKITSCSREQIPADPKLRYLHPWNLKSRRSLLSAPSSQGQVEMIHLEISI